MSSIASRDRVEIESLPVIGTTWYERGPAYWVRRAGLALFFLALLALDVAIVASILAPMLQRGNQRAPGLFLLVVVVVVGTAMGVWVWRRDPYGDRRSAQRAGRAGGAVGTASGSLGISGIGFGAILVPIAVAITIGPMLVYFIKSLTPVPVLERRARERLERSQRSGEQSHPNR
jgi:hypothetical protein